MVQTNTGQWAQQSSDSGGTQITDLGQTPEMVSWDLYYMGEYPAFYNSHTIYYAVSRG